MTAHQPPQWAIDLADQVARDEGVSERPRIKWSPSRSRWSSSSSGRAYSRFEPFRKKDGIDINIQAGGDPLDQKLVLLHELAHWLCEQNEKHGKKFWDKAFYLFRKYGIKGEVAISRERHYRAQARSAYNRSDYVTVDGLEPEYVYPRDRSRGCLCMCHREKVRA